MQSVRAHDVPILEFAAQAVLIDWILVQRLLWQLMDVSILNPREAERPRMIIGSFQHFNWAVKPAALGASRIRQHDE